MRDMTEKTRRSLRKLFPTPQLRRAGILTLDTKRVAPGAACYKLGVPKETQKILGQDGNSSEQKMISSVYFLRLINGTTMKKGKQKGKSRVYWIGSVRPADHASTLSLVSWLHGLSSYVYAPRTGEGKLENLRT